MSCPIDKLAFIAINEDSDETAERSEAIEQCKSFCMDEIKEHKLDPFKTEVFYIICGYAPYLTITEVCRIVNDTVHRTNLFTLRLRIMTDTFRALIRIDFANFLA